MEKDGVIKRVIAIIALSIATVCVILNLFCSVASASNTITYEMYVDMARNMVINAFNEKCANSEEYTEYICIYDVNHEDLNVVGTFVFMKPDVNITNVQTFNDKDWGEQIKITTDGLKSVYVNFNVKHNLENDIKLDVNIIDYTSIQESLSREHQIMTTNVYNKVKNFDYGLGLDNDNVVGGIPFQMNDIIFEHYYNKNTDESHKMYVTNNSEYDVYINLDCVIPTSSGDNVIYQYGENQLVSVAPFYYYHHLAYKSEEIAAKWLSYFLYDNATSELTEEEIYQNLMGSYDKWHKADYYSSGTCTIAYQYGLGLSLSECMTAERVSEITELENIISERNYAIEDSSKNINQKNTYIYLAANDTKEINVLKNQLTLTSGVKYEWILKIGSAVEKMVEHSRKGFTAISSSVGNDEIDNNVYDENGNIIGSYDGDNNIIVDEEINSDIDIDVSPDINTSSVKGFIQSVSEVIKMFWGILPPAVMSVIVFGLSIVLAVGVIRLVTG